MDCFLFGFLADSESNIFQSDIILWTFVLCLSYVHVPDLFGLVFMFGELHELS